MYTYEITIEILVVEPLPQQIKGVQYEGDMTTEQVILKGVDLDDALMTYVYRNSELYSYCDFDVITCRRYHNEMQH